ncbi:hypothetical protein FACS1894217_10720 [Clostridia bacterium]|nr:hypothetical protein FACS1894217_10720 [Clostridia bacterium]
MKRTIKLLLSVALCISTTLAISGCDNRGTTEQLPTPSPTETLDSSVMRPYKYNSVHANNMTEVKAFVNTNNPDEFYEGQYKTMIEGILEKGFLLEPRYDENPVWEFPVTPREDGDPVYPICLKFELNLEGGGYSFVVKIESTQILLHIYPVAESYQEVARNNPFPCLYGKYSELRTVQRALELGWTDVSQQFNNNAWGTVLYLQRGPDSNNPTADADSICFLYEGHMVYLLSYHQNPEDPAVTALQLAQHLTFEKIFL